MSSESKYFSKEDLFSCLKQSQEFGFLSPQPIEKQIIHSTNFISLLPEGIDLALDLGSGGGLPSLVWLHLNPTIQIVALDAMGKRTKFLESISKKYSGLNDRLTVLNGRAEIISHESQFREKFLVVVARGFGPPGVTAECASGFMKTKGRLFVSGRPDDEAQRWESNALSKLKLEFQEVLESGESHVASLQKIESLGEEYPRSSKMIKKYPLWS